MAANDLTNTGSAAASRSPGEDSSPVVGALRVMLGALFLSVFIENLLKGLYTQEGYARLITGYATNPKVTAPAFWREGAMPFLADNSALFGPLQALTELALGVALILGLATGLFALAATGLLFTLWFSELGIFWVWELLSLIIVAAVVTAATLPRLLDRAQPLHGRILGPPLFRRMSMAGRVGVAVVAGAGLGVSAFVTRTGLEEHYHEVSVLDGVALAGLLIVLALLDRRRVAAQGPGDR